MELILSTGSLYDRPFGQIVEEAVRGGFSRIEVMLTMELMGGIDAMRAILRDQGVEAPSVHAPFALDRYIAGHDRGWEELMGKVLGAAESLGAKIVVFHPGHLPLLPFAYSLRLRDMMENIGDLLPRASRSGASLAIENVPRPSPFPFLGARYLAWEPIEMMRIFGKLGKRGLRMTLDISHSSAVGEGVFADYIRHLGSYICNIHLSDFDGKVDHLPIGKGKVNFDGALKCVKDIRYDGLLTLELSPSHSDVEDIRESRRRIESILTTL
jgi:sugar phosphate isomerase/epimerase